MSPTSDYDADELTPHRARNRRTAESKLRRSLKHCPMCLEPLQLNSRRSKRVAACHSCNAHPSRDKRCMKCGAQAVWENKAGAACQACGVHGAKSEVIATST